MKKVSSSNNFTHSRLSKTLLCLVSFLAPSFLTHLLGDQNNTSFIVAGGDLNTPFYTLTFESNGSTVDFQNYPLRKGNTYFFKGGNISASHPFNIGSSHNVSSPHATGGPLDQNSANNGQSITVSIPNDFVGTLSYFCTVHATMLQEFTIAEPGGGEEPHGLPVFALDATQAGALSSTAPGAGNYTFEFYTDPATGSELREMIAAEQVEGQWQRVIDPASGGVTVYPLESIYPDMESVKTYLTGQGITDADALGYITDGQAGGDGPVVYFLDSASLLALTGSASATEGNYSIVEETDEAGTTYLTTKPMELDGGNWQEDVNGIPYPLDPAYGTMAQVDSYLAENNIQPVDTNGGGSGGEGGEPQGLPVFALDATQAGALSSTAPGAGNYTFEFYTDPGTGSELWEMIAAEQVEGQWQRVIDPASGGVTVYPLESIYPDMESVKTYLSGQGITDADALGYITDGQAGGDGPVVYFLDSASLLALTGSASATEGNYSIVEETDEAGTTYLTTKPMELDGGNWQEDVNGIPYPLDPAYGTMAQVDSYLAENNIQPVDQSGGGSGGEGGEPHGLPVFALDATQAGALSSTAPGAGNYTFEFYTDLATGSELREMIAAEQVEGQWQRVIDPASGGVTVYPLESIYPDMESVKTYLTGQGITDADALGYITDGQAGGDGPVVYFLDSASLLALTGSASATEGNYSIVEETDEAGTTYLTTKPMELDGGNWQEDVNGIPYPLDPAYGTMAQVDSYLAENNIQPVDQSGGGSGGEGGEPHGLPVFALDATQAGALSSTAPGAGNYTFEFYTDPATGSELREMIAAEQVEGQWQRVIDPASGGVTVYPLESIYPDMESVKTYLTGQGITDADALGYITDGQAGGDGPVVYFLDSASLLALTGSASATEGNYSIVEETDEAGTTYLTTKPMELDGGNWQEDVNGIPYPLDPAYGTMAQVDSYLAENNIQPVDQSGGGSGGEGGEPHGLPVFALDATQAGALSSTAPGAGNYTFEFYTDPATGSELREMIAAEQVEGQWQRVIDPASGGVTVYPLESIYPDMESVKTYLTGQGITDADALGYITDGQAGGDGPVVYFLDSASLLALTGSASATEGNYSIVEETDEAGTTYLTTKPMELDGGNWQEDVNGIPYPLDPAYGTMAQVDSYLAENNIQPVDQSGGGSGGEGGEPHGLPVFALDATQAGALSSTAPGAGNYTFEFYTDPATGSELREMIAAEQVEGQWQRVIDPASGGVTVYPLESIYPDMESVKTYLTGQGITDADALGYITDGQAGGDGPVVYFLDSASLLALTGSASATEGNYSIVEETDEAGTTYLTTKPMELDGGNWQEDVNGIPYPLDPAYGTMAQVDSYLAENNIQPVDQSGGGSGGEGGEPHGLPVFALDATQAGALSSTAPGAGNYTFEFYTDPATGSELREMIAAEQVEGQWQRVIDPASGGVTVYPLESIYPDMESVKTYLTGQGITDADALGYITDGQAGGDGPVVYFLDSASLLALTGSASATEGNYSIVEETDEAGTTYLTTKPMELDGGNWQEDVNGIPYPLDPAYGTMAQVDSYLAENNIQPVDQSGGGSGGEGGEPHGLPVFALDATQAGALSSTAPGAGNYTFEFYTDPATGSELREMIAAEQVEGQWQRVIDPASGGVTVYPLESIYPDMESVKTYLTGQGITDADALGYITDGQAGGDGPVVYFLNSASLLALTGSASAPEGNYSIVEETDEAGTTYLTTKPMELVGGNWQEDVNGIPYPLDPAYGTMAQVDSYLAENNIQPVDQSGGGSGGEGGEPHGLPVFNLTMNQAESLVDGYAPAGSYAVEIFIDSDTGIEQRLLVGAVQLAGEWEREFDAVGNPVELPISSAHFPTTDAIYQYIDQQNLEPIGYIIEQHDHNGTDPGGDYNGTDPGTGGDQNGTQGLPVFALTMNQAETLIDGYAPAGSYAVEIFIDSDTGIEQRLLVGAVQLAGEWERELDAVGNPVELPISSAHFPTTDAIYQYIDQQNLEPIGFIIEDHQGHDPEDPHNPGTDHDYEGLPVFNLTMNQAESLVDGYAPAGSYAVEIFIDSDTGIEQRLLVGAVQLAGEWEREFDAVGNPVELPISSAHFPTTDAIYQYIDQQNLEPIGYIIEQHDHNGTDPGGDYNGTDPGTGGDQNGTQGLPVFALTMNQAETLIDGYAPAGSYALKSL